MGLQGAAAGTNTYVTVSGSLSLKSHLGVRDTLRARPELRNRYSAVKKLVGATAGDIEEYGKGNNAAIQKILAVAGFTDGERGVIDTAQVLSRTEVPR